MWHPQWSHFAATNPLVRIDMRGFGENPPATEPFRRSDDVMAVLDAEGIEQAIFVGGSMGGRVALDVAIDHPERILGLMLIGAAGPSHDWSPEVQKLWAAESAALDQADIDLAVEVNLDFWLDGPDREAADLSAADRQLVADMQRRAFELELAHPGAVDETRRTDLDDRLPDIAVPASVLYGDCDARDIEQIARVLAAALPDAELHPVPNTAHLPALESPDLCNSVLEQLIARVLATNPGA